MKLITEMYDDFEVLQEGDSKSTKIKGVFMQAETKNRNGRIYPMEILNKEVTRYNKELVEKKRAFGELGHPDGPTVNLDRVSHLIRNYIPKVRISSGKQRFLILPMGKLSRNC